MVIIYSAPAVHIEYKCTYNLLARATYVPKNVVAAFRHVSFQCVVARSINVALEQFKSKEIFVFFNKDYLSNDCDKKLSLL